MPRLDNDYSDFSKEDGLPGIDRDDAIERIIHAILTAMRGKRDGE